MLKKKKEEILLSNAHVITLDKKMPKAKAVLVSSGRIKGVFADEIPRNIPLRGVRVINCGGKTLIPGFVDAHCHLESFIETFVYVDLSPQSGVKSIRDIKNKIRQACLKTKPGTWIKGKGYDEFFLQEKRHPTRFDLDEVAPFHPVKITHRTGRVHVLNTLGMKMVGIGPEFEDLEDGFIERDLHTGEPTGVLYGMGRFLSQRIPKVTEEELEKVLKLADEKFVSMGLTYLNDCTFHNDLTSLEKIEKWKKKGLITPSIRIMLKPEVFEENKLKLEEFKKEVKIGGAKIVIHKITGRLYPQPEEFKTKVETLHKKRVQLAIHAIEDDEIALLIETLLQILKRYPVYHRHRIEHCFLCPNPFLKKISSLNLIVVTQPAFIYFNGEKYLNVVPPERMQDLYRMSSFLKKGIIIAAGSDLPIGVLNPFISIFTCLSRKTIEGNFINKKEAITFEEALKMHTLWAAYACFEENERGSITPGKIADLVLLNENVEQISEEEIKTLKPILTMVKGDVVWQESEKLN